MDKLYPLVPIILDVNTSKQQPSVFIFILMVTMVAVSLHFFSNAKHQSINWTFPYFSGAANFEEVFVWQISPSDFERAKLLTPAEYKKYRHKPTEDKITYSYNNYGYVLVAILSRNLFPFVGDLQGVIYLQILVHFFSCFFLICITLKTRTQRLGFIFLYAANPLVIHFVTFPFYYYWLFLPSFVFAIFILKPEWRRWCVFAAIPLLLFSHLIRPTSIFLAGCAFIIAVRLATRVLEKFLASTALAVFTFSAFYVSTLFQGSPWHTIYIGLGAYENNFGVSRMSDEQGFEYFRQKTGVLLSTNPISGNFIDNKIRERYMESVQMRYFEIAREAPEIIVRNAFLNVLQVFSVGHIVDRPKLSYLNSFIGLLVVCFLIFTKQKIWALGALLSAAGFVFYYPPIPAYNFGAYVLLSFGVVLGFEKTLIWISKNRKMTAVQED